jgi:hypothetical protein
MKTLIHPCYIVLLFVETLLLLAGLPAQASPAQLLAAYTFDGSAADTTGTSPPMELRNAPLSSGFLYLNGMFEGGNPDGFHAWARIPALSYASFTLAFDFDALDYACPQPSCHNNLIAGGFSYRWFSLRHNAGKLEVTLNNQALTYVIANSEIRTSQWQSVICSLNVATRKIVTFVNNLRVADIDLPVGFQFDVIGTPAENSDKEFTFANYSNGSTFYGYVDNLKVWNRALSASEIDDLIDNPSLTIQKAVIVSWPKFPPGYYLRCSSNIAGPYEFYTGVAFEESSQYKAPVPLGGSQKFFQLYRP